MVFHTRRKFRKRGRTRPLGGPIRRRFRRRRPMTSGRVKRIIDAELKLNDLGVGPLDLPSGTGQVNQITNIAQGDSNTQRQGNWIKPTSWMGTITLTGNDANLDTTTQFRVGCVMWKENQNINPISIAQLMQDPVAPHQQYKVENKGQFKILWSRTGIVSNNTDNSQFQKVLRFYVRPSMKVFYDTADSLKNHLFLFAFSNVAAGSSPPSYSFDMRVRYTDS